MTEESTTKRLELYKRLAQHYSIIPLHPRSKIPKEAQWTRWCYKNENLRKATSLFMMLKEFKLGMLVLPADLQVVS